MTWEILAALITVVLALVTLGGVLARFMRTLTKLECAINSIQQTADRFEKNSDKTHAEMYGVLESHHQRLDEHETRIHDLERR